MPVEMMSPIDAGRTLSEIRKVAEMSQAALAQKLGIDASKVSRVETGEIAPSVREIAAFTRAIGTAEARAYLGHVKRNFRVLERPDFRHPDREILWTAEEALQRLDAFVNDLDNFEALVSIRGSLLVVAYQSSRA